MLKLGLSLGLESEKRVRGLLLSSEPSRERVKVSHMIVKCGVINHYPQFH